jgi:hypothetical protein
MGNRTVLSDASVDRGPLLMEAMGLAVEASGALTAVDVILDAAVRIDPVSGHRTVVSR